MARLLTGEHADVLISEFLNATALLTSLHADVLINTAPAVTVTPPTTGGSHSLKMDWLARKRRRENLERQMR